jgi:hypothetical protein
MLRDVSETDAALIKGMLQRGDKQSDIAAWFRVNSGRISETNTGRRFRNVKPATAHALPPPGPYAYFAGQSIELLPLIKRLEKILAEHDLKRAREVAAGDRQLQEVQEKVDLLLRKVTGLEREVGIVEKPRAPRVSRRKPLG